MADPTVAVKRGAAPDIEVARDQWIPFCAEFTRENRGAHAVLEVLGGDVGCQVETEDRPFDGVTADVKDWEDTVWITFGDTPEYHLAHSASNVTAIHVRPPTGLFGAALLIESQDGSKRLLELSLPEEYALPPAPPKTTSL
jgi:hypothetical protein